MKEKYIHESEIDVHFFGKQKKLVIARGIHIQENKDEHKHYLHLGIIKEISETFSCGY